MSQSRNLSSKIRQLNKEFKNYLSLYEYDYEIADGIFSNGLEIDFDLFKMLFNDQSKVFSDIRTIQQRLNDDEASAQILAMIGYLDSEQLNAYLNTSPQFTSVKSQVLSLYNQIHQAQHYGVQQALQGVVRCSAEKCLLEQNENIFLLDRESAIRLADEAILIEEQIAQDEAIARSLEAFENESILQQIAKDEAFARQLAQENAPVAPAPAPVSSHKEPVVSPLPEMKRSLPAEIEVSENDTHAYLEKMLGKVETAKKVKNISSAALEMFFGEYGTVRNLFETLDESFQDPVTEATFYHYFLNGNQNQLSDFIDRTPALRSEKESIIELFKQFNNTPEAHVHEDGVSQNGPVGALDKILTPFSNAKSLKSNSTGIQNILKDFVNAKYSSTKETLTPDEKISLQVEEDRLLALQLQGEEPSNNCFSDESKEQYDFGYAASSAFRLFQPAAPLLSQCDRDEALLICYLAFEERNNPFNAFNAALQLSLQFQLLTQISFMAVSSAFNVVSDVPSYRAFSFN